MTDLKKEKKIQEETISDHFDFEGVWGLKKNNNNNFSCHLAVVTVPVAVVRVR